MAPATRHDDAGPIVERILFLHGQRVLLDEDLAALYGVTVRRLNERVKRNRGKFPKDFAFSITIKELRHLKSHFATSSWGGRRKPTWAFTEHGAIMAATVLNSQRAEEMSVYVVRAFVKLRAVFATNVELARKLEAPEKSVATLDGRTRRQFEDVYEAIRALMTPPAAKSRSIGFTADVEGKRE